MTTDLRQRIADAIDRLRETGAVYAIEDHERDRIADTLLPLVAAERAAILRIVTDWCIEANENGGVDAGDLAYRLESAGYPLPDDDEDARADAEAGGQ